MQLSVPEALKLAVNHHKADRLDQAEELYKLIVQAEPNNPDALAMYGTLLSQRGHHDTGLQMMDRAISLKPDAPDFHANLGLILFSDGQIDAAILSYQKALQLRPDVANVHYNLGNALQRKNEIDDAIACYQQALAIKRDDANSWCNLGGALLKKDQIPGAVVAFRNAIKFQPGYAEAMSNLGTALMRQHKTDEATEWYSKANFLRPQVPEIVNNYAGALKDSGRLDEALACYRRCLAAGPNPQVHSNLIYLLQFHSDYDGRSIAMELKRWNQIYAAQFAKGIQTHLNHSVPDRRLKIGYVSPNFFDQAEAHFVLPLLSTHDRENFQIHCFSCVRRPDAITERHRQLADVWHDCSQDDDETLDKKIREAHIDILVDLTMHLGDNRLLVFARKPAPIQLTWLAYPGSTGLTTIDYRLTDNVIDPPNSDDSIYSEKSIRLPGCWVCYDPLSEAEPRPFAQNGPITFGSLNNPCKINPGTLRIWAQILKQLPDSRLVMLSVSATQQLQIRRIFDEFGISFQRLDFVMPTSREQYLRQYDRIDIALDPGPYNGITTTCDALWMGVPVVTFAGLTAAGRAGGNILVAAGFPELVGKSAQQLVQLAVELARDESRLLTLRSNLRHRVTKSPLMDAPQFTHNIEQLYREAWTRWCARSKMTNPSLPPGNGLHSKGVIGSQIKRRWQIIWRPL